MSFCAAGLVYFEWVVPRPDLLPAPGEELFVDSGAVRLGGVWHVAAAGLSLNANPLLLYPAGEGLVDLAVREKLKKSGIRLQEFPAGDNPAISVIFTEQGERSFISRGEHQVLDALVFPPEEEWIHIPGLPEAMAMRKQIIIALERGQKISLSSSWSPELLDTFADFDFFKNHKVDLLVMNQKEALRASNTNGAQEAMERLSSLSKNTVITLGARGATARWEDGQSDSFFQEPRELEDTTGAGDSFVAALLCSFAQKIPQDQRLPFAAKAAYEYLTKERS